MFELSFHGSKFEIPKGKLISLFEHRTDLITSSSYEVQSKVPIEIFETFVRALETGTKVSVTNDNVDSILRLAEEFWLGELISECSILRARFVSDSIVRLSDRVAEMEHQTTIIPEMREMLANYGRQLELIVSSLIKIPAEVLPTEKTEVLPTEKTEVLPTEKTFELRAPASLDGIIAHLMDVMDGTWFTSLSRAGECICWDFGKSRVRPTHYTIKSRSLKSWVIESSLDGENWIEIDRQTDNSDLKPRPHLASFAVSKSDECRFIRLTQTSENDSESHSLGVSAFEVFGTLLDGRE
jgi:hypothetical protein